MIFVTGATGKVGRELVRRLQEARRTDRRTEETPAERAYALSGPEALSNAEEILDLARYYRTGAAEDHALGRADHRKKADILRRVRLRPRVGMKVARWIEP